MPKSKKKFIDRKSAVTFNLVHRSQQDPLVTDESAPQHVLQAASTSTKRSKDDDKRKEQQQKFGVFFDDEYNYLQHLRDANTLSVEWEPVERYRIQKNEPVPTKLPGPDTQSTRLNLPSSVFASEFEEDVGLLNKAAPDTGLRLDLDPDVVAAMDEDFDFSDPENELEDDFIALANAEPGSDCSDDDNYADVSSGAEEEDDDVASLDGPQHSFNEEETKSRFTSYSMSSSVMRRNEQLSILDGRFEHMFAGYDESEIGALDCEEIEGHVPANSEILLACAEEFKRDRASQKHETDRTATVRCLDAMGSDDDFQDLEIPERNVEKWDCESVLSTCSTLYNHPKLIAEPKGPGKIRISGRTGMPIGVLDGKDGKLTAKALAKLNEDEEGDSSDDDGAETMMSTLSMLSIRPKDETPEDRLQRKKALKEYRRERRLERKANTLAFKEEKKRQEKIFLNNKNNIQGMKIV